MNYEEHLSKIRNKEKYSFSRWGDGEWACLLGKQGMNCDKHTYFPDMGGRLFNVLKSKPNYYIGLQSLAHRIYRDAIDRITNKCSLNWVGSDVFHRASMKGRLNELFDALDGRNVILVGGSHLKGFKDWGFIEVPSVNCWLEHDRVLDDLKKTIKEDDVVLFCASMMSNVLIDELHGVATLIDMGSVFDPYVNVNSRKYHKDLKI
jgi:hypothetical protein